MSEADRRPLGAEDPTGPVPVSAERIPTTQMPVVDDDLSEIPAADAPRRSPILSQDPTGDPVRLDPLSYDIAGHDQSLDARPYLKRLEQDSSAARWPAFVIVGSVLVLIVMGIWFVSQLRSGPDGETSAFGGRSVEGSSSTVDLARATVQILGLDTNGEALCAGSGTFVSADGLILTNAHVATSDSVCSFTTLGVAVTTDIDRPPDLLYQAEVVAIDASIDLAVVRVVATVDPSQSLPTSFPALALGDSDLLTIGDDLRILGYPQIGGETITFTNGTVAGFSSQEDLGDRALIKTDATVAGGNSGGAAVGADGRLVAIPTRAGVSDSGPAVDCRPLADTNGDGSVDTNDTCVPIGGFINALRPVELARPLLEQARQGPGDDENRVRVDPATVAMSRPRFSLGEVDNNPVEVIHTAIAGSTELCLFVDWQGIPDGVKWDALWFVDSVLIEEYSLRGQFWEFGEAGSNLWMCAIDESNGLEPGLYELGFFVDDQLIFAEGIELTDEPVEVFPTVWENETSADMCWLAINPAGSGQVGLNELPRGNTIPPGGSVTIDLPLRPVVVEARDCNGGLLADSNGAMELLADHSYPISEPG